MPNSNELLHTSGMIIMTPSNTWIATKISSTDMDNVNRIININDNCYKISRVDESIIDTFNTDQFSQFKKKIGNELCDEPVKMMNDNSLLTYANTFSGIISNTKGSISYAEIKDIKKKYHDNNYVNIINFLLYEINMLLICKEILSKNKKLNKRNILFLHHVLHKYSISLSSSSLIKKINDRIEKNVYDITTYVKHTKKDIANLQKHFVNQSNYKDYEYNNSNKSVIYKDPSRPDVNFLQSVSVGMSRNTTLSSISFGLG